MLHDPRVDVPEHLERHGAVEARPGPLEQPDQRTHLIGYAGQVGRHLRVAQDLHQLGVEILEPRHRELVAGPHLEEQLGEQQPRLRLGLQLLDAAHVEVGEHQRELLAVVQRPLPERGGRGDQPAGRVVLGLGVARRARSRRQRPRRCPSRRSGRDPRGCPRSGRSRAASCPPRWRPRAASSRRFRSPADARPRRCGAWSRRGSARGSASRGKHPSKRWGLTGYEFTPLTC